MVRFNVNAMPDLLAMDSVAKEVGSSVNVAKEYPSSWVVCVTFQHRTANSMAVCILHFYCFLKDKYEK